MRKLLKASLEAMRKMLRLISEILQGFWKIGEYITKGFMKKTLQLINTILQGFWKISEYITKGFMKKTLRLINTILQGFWKISVYITKEVMIKTLRLISAILQGFWRIGVYITKEVMIKTLRLISAILQGFWRIGAYITKKVMIKTLQLIGAILPGFWRIRKDKYTKEVKNSLRFLLLLRIREAFLNARFPDHDERLNDAIWIAGMKLAEEFDEKKLDQDPDFSMGGIKIERFGGIYYAHKEHVEEIIKSVEKNERVQATKKYYGLVSHRLSYLPGGRKKLADYYRELAELDPEAVPLTSKSLKEIHKEIHKGTRKEIKRVKKAFTGFSFSFSDLAAILGSVSPFFFITGYFYNSILFSSFGIEVSNFFSWDDYITSSMKKIEPSLSLALIYTVIMYVIFRITNYYPQKSKYEIVQRLGLAPSFVVLFLYNWVVPFIFYSMVFFFGGIWLILSSEDGDWFRLLWADEVWRPVIIIAFIVAVFILMLIDRGARKNSKRLMLTSFLPAFFLFLSAHIVYSLLTHTCTIDGNTSDSPKKYEFTFSKTYPYQEKEKDMVLIVNGREFYIFRDIKSRTNIVVPREEIVSVKDIKNKKNQDNFMSILKMLIGWENQNNFILAPKALIRWECPKRLAKLGGGAPELQDTSRRRFG